MRNPDRLETFYNEMKSLHQQYFCDWRFGQLCANFFGWLISEKKTDFFFPEEEEMLNYFLEFCSFMAPSNETPTTSQTKTIH